MKPQFTAAASGGVFSGIYSLFHKACVVSMLFMALSATASPVGAALSFMDHIMQGLASAPDAISNVAGWFAADGGTTAHALAGGGAGAVSSGAGATAVLNCTPPYADYSTYFNCLSPDQQFMYKEAASVAQTPIQDFVGKQCSTGMRHLFRSQAWLAP